MGYTLNDAKKILEKDGLKLGTISYDYSEVYKEGTVINQNPVVGVGSIKKGDSVNVVVSKGQKPVENHEQNNTNNDEKQDSNENIDNNDSNNNNNDNNSNNDNNRSEERRVGKEC